MSNKTPQVALCHAAVSPAGAHRKARLLFFPQMKPETIETNAATDTGLSHIPAPWNDVISRMGITSKQQLKEANPNKLFNDMGGMRKKLKLDISMVTLEEVKSWINV